MLPAPGPGDARYDPAFAAGFPQKSKRIGQVLLPRETGAVAQFLLSLVTALIAAHARTAAVLLAISAIALVLAHEPFMIVANLRGPKRRHEEGQRAWRQLVAAPLIALFFGGAGLLVAPASLPWTLVPALPAILFLPLMLGRLERTGEGEILATLTFCGFAAPVAAAGGVESARVLVITGAFAIALTTSTLAVRVVTGTAHTAMTRRRFFAPIGVGTVGLTATLAGAATGLVPLGAPLALMPVLAFSLYIVLLPPRLRHIRKVGWGFVTSNLVMAVVLLQL